MADKIRIDKWLWTVRIFKSRTLAGDACKTNKVKQNGKQAKSSSLVTIGDEIDVKKGGFSFTFKVKMILKSRVSAVLAADAFDNITSAEELNKYNSWFVGKGGVEIRDRGTGRPTKKERREIDDYKIVGFDEWWNEEE